MPGIGCSKRIHDDREAQRSGAASVAGPQYGADGASRKPGPPTRNRARGIVQSVTGVLPGLEERSPPKRHFDRHRHRHRHRIVEIDPLRSEGMDLWPAQELKNAFAGTATGSTRKATP
jgi:hypothetical protein